MPNMINISHKINKLRRIQSGMSLIELMISMVVGLFMLAGMVTNFIGTKDADRMRDAMSEMDANAVVVFQVLRPAIAHAGYASIANTRVEKPFHTDEDDIADNPKCRGGTSNIAWSETVQNYTRDYANRDQITVVSMADNPCKPGLASCANAADRNPAALVYTDCTGGGADTSDPRVVSCSTDHENGGMADPTQAKIYNSFTLLRNISSDDDRVLYCQGSRGGTQPIVDNVEAIQYLYGVTDSTGKTFYRRADQVESKGQWGMVTSVQVGLLMRSSRQHLLKEPSSKKIYYLLKRKVDIADRDLRRLFKVYTTTINLENLKKAPL